MSDVFIVGAGMNSCEKLVDRTVKDLTWDAVSEALAGGEKPNIGAAFLANASPSPVEGRQMAAEQIALGNTGFGPARRTRQGAVTPSPQ